MSKTIALLGFVVLLGACTADHPFGQLGGLGFPEPPPITEPLFAEGVELGTVIVAGTASIPNKPRPKARVSLLNLNVGSGVVVVTGPDALYQVVIPGVEGDLLEVTIEFDENNDGTPDFFREEFVISLP